MTFRSFAIVPAAGRSERMGNPKLRLPWGGSTIIETVLVAWRAGGVEQIVVTVHPDDGELAELCRRSGAEVVVPTVPPPDMKASVLAGLQYVTARHAPVAADAWLMAPADLPLLSAEIIAHLLQEHPFEPNRILVPVLGGRRGHPVLFPWAWAERAASLPENVGLNALLRSEDVREVAFASAISDDDVDMPEDYGRLKNRYSR